MCAALTAASRPRKLHFAPFCALHRTCAHFVARPLPVAPALLGCAGFPDARCHSLLLASSAAGGARNRPPLHSIRISLSFFMEDAAGIEPASHGCATRASSNARPCHFHEILCRAETCPRRVHKLPISYRFVHLYCLPLTRSAGTFPSLCRHSQPAPYGATTRRAAAGTLIPVIARSAATWQSNPHPVGRDDPARRLRHSHPCHCETSAHTTRKWYAASVTLVPRERLRSGRDNLISNLPDFHRRGFRKQLRRQKPVI